MLVFLLLPLQKQFFVNLAKIILHEGGFMKKKFYVTAIALFACILLLTGTFAWTNFASSIMNIFTGTGAPEGDNNDVTLSTPGGTLHNDYEYGNDYRDIYVENWGTEPLIIRIRLAEYMEIGPGAGIRNDSANNQADSIIYGASIDDTETWEPFTGALRSDENAEAKTFSDYWEWTMGGSKYYFPAPEHLRGKPDEDGIDFVSTTSPAFIGEADREFAELTLYANVIMMSEWLDKGKPLGHFWVIDTDGFSYWAAPLEPGEATGLLLHKVELIGNPAGYYYYAIHVDAQMATIDNAPGNYEMFFDTATPDGIELLNALAESISVIGLEELGIEGLLLDGTDIELEDEILRIMESDEIQEAIDKFVLDYLYSVELAGNASEEFDIEFVYLEQFTERNDYPIFLVPGLGGWGPDDLGSFSYWGGSQSITRFLNRQGLRTYEVAVGPFSSNRDRAIELYYFIKGGTVDYGAYHAARYRHARFGHTFPGIYQQWSDEAKIHLIGHSLGGLTSRELANLIAVGCEREIRFHERNPHLAISPLLAGETTGGIHSITTIGTPNNGTSFAESQNILVPFAQRMVITAASMSGVASNRVIYDFRLDQFGLSRNPGESLTSYTNRVFSSPIWRSNDMAFFDLSVRGVTANAVNLQTRPDIYYFSHTGQTTRRMPIVGEMPLRSTTPFLKPSALFMSRHRNLRSRPPINNSWAASDGMVNTISSLHPFGHPARPYDGSPNPGEWSFHPVMHGWDHGNLHGIGNTNQAFQLYLSMARRVRSLPR